MGRNYRLIVAGVALSMAVTLAAGCGGEKAGQSSKVTIDWSYQAIPDLGIWLRVPPNHTLAYKPDEGVEFLATNSTDNTWIIVRAAQWRGSRSPDLNELIDHVGKRPEAIDGAEKPAYWSNNMCGSVALAFDAVSMERDSMCHGRERFAVIKGRAIDVLFCASKGPLEGPASETADVVLNSVTCDDPSGK